MKKKIRLLLAFALLCAACTPKSEMDRFIDELMGRMTLDQKIGQLNLHSAPGFISAEKVMEEDGNIKLLRQGMLGGIYGSGNPELLRQCQEIALESGAGIPLIFGMDVIHGHETVFPVPLALSKLMASDEPLPSGSMALLFAFGGGLAYAGQIITIP